MEEGIIRYKLDLMIRLLDATTGNVVDERNIHFKCEDQNLEAHARGEGCYIFMGRGREDCLMQIDVYGFEPKTMRVVYEELDPILPTIDVFLIPSENRRRGEPLLTLKGTISGLEAVEAIHPGRPVTSIRDFDVKKRVMTVFSPNRRVDLKDQYYGIMNAEKGSFEDIEIEEELTDKKVRLRKLLEEEFLPNSPICRIIYGQVEQDGSYLLRVRDSGKNQNYLVKYIVNGETRYKNIDFHQLDGIALD